MVYRAPLALYRKHLLTSDLDHLCFDSVLYFVFLVKMHRRLGYIIQLLFYFEAAYFIFSQIPIDRAIQHIICSFDFRCQMMSVRR